MELNSTYVEFENWLSQIINGNQPEEGVKAFNFGIFEGEKDYYVYLIGAKEYSETDEDWACCEDFVPDNKYFLLPNSAGKSWEEVQKFVSELILKFLKSPIYENSFFSKAIAITSGFDGGMLMKLKT